MIKVADYKWRRSGPHLVSEAVSSLPTRKKNSMDRPWEMYADEPIKAFESVP